MTAALALMLAASRQAVVFKDTPDHYTAPINTPLPVNPDPNADPMPIHETPAQKAKRMKWWTEARFGLFLHWGTYAVPAGTWGGHTNYAEWIRNSAQIPLQTYNKFATEFDPTQFNADAWVKMAKNAGMKYIVITSKHHEGFNMFASKYSEYNIMNTPWHHDPMKDLAKACKKYGMKFGFYYSIMDWHDYNYLPRRSWEVSYRPDGTANFQTYAEYMFHEIDQLLTEYGPISVLWFDGEWESTWREPYGTELYNLCRTLQPNIIVNNRVGHARNAVLGDYETPEQTIPATGLPGVDWETCMTMNDHWGYNSHDHDYKSVKTLIRNLVDIASKGGNYLLNIGPSAQGTFPPQAVQTLKGIGDWMHVNSRAIYDTTASLYPNLGWGRCTVRKNKSSTQLYYEVFNWPSSGKLIVPGTHADVVAAHLLGSNIRLKTRQSGPNLVIELPKQEPNSVCPVVGVEVKGYPLVFTTPSVTSDTPQFTDTAQATIHESPGVEVRYTIDGTSPTASSSVYSHPIVVTHDCTVIAAAFNKRHKVSEDASLAFTKVTPLPSSQIGKLTDGLKVIELDGKFATAAEVAAAPSTSRTVEPVPELDPAWGNNVKENVGRIFVGYINVPSDGLWRFRLNSDDGSMLYIDGQTVVDNDGLHSSQAKEGGIPLAKGWHGFRVIYFNATGSAALNLKWAKGAGTMSDVPASAFGHVS